MKPTMFKINNFNEVQMHINWIYNLKRLICMLYMNWIPNKRKSDFLIPKSMKACQGEKAQKVVFFKEPMC
jgi:hypothetical protein